MAYAAALATQDPYSTELGWGIEPETPQRPEPEVGFFICCARAGTPNTCYFPSKMLLSAISYTILKCLPNAILSTEFPFSKKVGMNI